MLSSLRSKILLTLLGAVFISALLIMFMVQHRVEKKISQLQNYNAQHLIATVAINVDSQYQNLLYYKKDLLAQRKKKLHDIVSIALVAIEVQYRAFKEGSLTEDEAKTKAKEVVKLIRYGDDVGYIWINDTKRPIPHMIMHPTMPQLEGKVLDDISFYSAQGKDKNLFASAVDTALKSGEGYLNYLWPKPRQEGLSGWQGKLSFVKLFPEWNWVVGTGIYLDDIEKKEKARLDVILTELADIFSQAKVGESGYLYLFTGEKEMLIHPSLEGADFSKFVNPTTGNPILDDLIRAEKSPSKVLEYVWDKPPDHTGDFRFWKKSHVTYFAPLDWYIASSVYTDEIEAPAVEISRYIILTTIVILCCTFFLSVLLSRSLTYPLRKLTTAAQKINYDNLTNATVPVIGTIETRRLGSILNTMLTSIREALQIKEELFKEKLALETRLHKTEKLESVGRLAAGIAHEINTPTQYVSTNIEFLNDASTDITELLTKVAEINSLTRKEGGLDDTRREEIEKSFEQADWDYIKEEIPKALEQSQEGLRRISQIVSAMKTFSHPGSGAMEPTDINVGVESTVTVARNEWKYVAEMILLLDEDLPHVPCYIDDLNQVILNMIINSTHAIKDAGQEDGMPSGTITISTQRIDDYAQIRITDTGRGMEEEVVEKIFDPFYTTKDVGKGTGQGLAIAHDVIVNKHLGKVEVETKVGEGTTFIISLPLDKKS